MYNLELDRIIKTVKDKEYKLVLLQFPDGLKSQSNEVINKIETETSAKCLTWFGSCFGACDIPNFSRLDIDLFVAFGHNIFVKDWSDR